MRDYQAIKKSTTKAQALLELAIFASLFILCLSIFISYGLSMNYQQNMQMQTFRKALTMASEPQAYTDTTTLVVVEDKKIPDVSSPFGSNPRSSYIGAESITRTNELYNVESQYDDGSWHSELKPPYLYMAFANDATEPLTYGAYSGYYPQTGWMALGIGPHNISNVGRVYAFELAGFRQIIPPSSDGGGGGNGGEGENPEIPGDIGLDPGEYPDGCWWRVKEPDDNDTYLLSGAEGSDEIYWYWKYVSCNSPQTLEDGGVGYGSSVDVDNDGKMETYYWQDFDSHTYCTDCRNLHNGYEADSSYCPYPEVNGDGYHCYNDSWVTSGGWAYYVYDPKKAILNSAISRDDLAEGERLQGLQPDIQTIFTADNTLTATGYQMNEAVATTTRNETETIRRRILLNPDATFSGYLDDHGLSDRDLEVEGINETRRTSEFKARR